MIYDWECLKCGKKESIVTHNYDDYNKPPEKSGDNCDHVWEKQLSTFKTVYSQGNLKGKM